MLICVQNLVKRYGNLLALDHFDLQVREGEIVGLLPMVHDGQHLLALPKYLFLFSPV